jgi:hypothetical protein
VQRECLPLTARLSFNCLRKAVRILLHRVRWIHVLALSICSVLLFYLRTDFYQAPFFYQAFVLAFVALDVAGIAYLARYAWSPVEECGPYRGLQNIIKRLVRYGMRHVGIPALATILLGLNFGTAILVINLVIVAVMIIRSKRRNSRKPRGSFPG